MSKIIEFDGQNHEFPDDFSDEDIGRALSSHSPQKSPQAASAPESVSADAGSPEYRAAMEATQAAQSALMGPGSIVGGTLLAGQLNAEKRISDFETTKQMADDEGDKIAAEASDLKWRNEPIEKTLHDMAEEDFRSTAEAAKKAQTAPIITLPKPKITGPVSAFINNFESTAEGLATGENIALATALPILPPLLQTLAGYGFGATMLKSAGEEAGTAVVKSQEGDPTEAGAAAGRAAASLIGGALPVLHSGGRAPMSAQERLAGNMLGLTPEAAERLSKLAPETAKAAGVPVETPAPSIAPLTEAVARETPSAKTAEAPEGSVVVNGADNPPVSAEPVLDTAEKAAEHAQREGFTEPSPEPSKESAPQGNADGEGSSGAPEPAAQGAGASAEKVESPLEKARRVVAEREQDLIFARQEGDYELAASLNRVLPKMRRDLVELEKGAPKETAPVALQPKELWQVSRDEVGAQKSDHRAAVKEAVAKGQPVPDAVLEEYSGAAWADKELARRRKSDKAAAEPTKPKTRIELLLDEVEKSGEVTITIDGPQPSREMVQMVQSAAEARGMTAAYDGTGYLIRKNPRAVPEVVKSEPVKTPRLKAGQKQGDLLGGGSEDLTLKGEKIIEEAQKKATPEPTVSETVADAVKAYGDPIKAHEHLQEQIDHSDTSHADRTRMRAAQRKLENMMADESHAESQADLDEQMSGKHELIQSIKELGGLPTLGEKGKYATGELKRVMESAKGAFLKMFRNGAKSLDELRISLEDRGFSFETPYDMLAAIEDSLATGKKKYGLLSGDDWTGATRMKRGGGESGAILVPKIKLENRKMSELDKATAERSGKLQRSTDDARRAQREIKRAIPSETRQGAVSVWIEADGDMAKLAAWEAGAKEKVFREAAKAAQSLKPEEIAIAKKVQASFKVLEARGNKYDVLKSHRDNYVPHVWEVENKKTGFGSARLQDRFKFAKARTFDTFADGDAAGFKPKTLAIGKLLPAYLHEMNKVIADRQFVEDISGRKAKDGRPLVVPRGRVSEIETTPGDKAYLANPRAMKTTKDAAGDKIDTSDYKTPENQPALHDWRWEGKDADGNPIFMKDDLALHPEAAKRLNAMLGKSAIREWYNEPSSGTAVIPKAIVKNLDTAQSVMKREMFSLLAPFHQVQEGTHAVGHLVNPFFGIPKINLRDAAQLDATKHGLMLLPDKVSGQGYIEGLGGKGGFISQGSRALAKKLTEGIDWKGAKIKGSEIAGRAAGTVADVIDGYQDYLFHQYIPGLKFKTYEAIFGRNMARFADELKRGELKEADVKLLSAEQTNAAYGHLNYALLDRNPTMQHILQLGLLAPDFLEARARFVGQAAKGAIGGKVGAEQFKAIAILAAAQAGIAFTISSLMGDKWDPKNPFVITHKGRSYTLRSVPEDLLRFGADIHGMATGGDKGTPFISARINPLAQKVDQLRTGLNYRGEHVTARDTMEELLASYIPITARQIPGLRQLTETSRQSPISPLEQLAGSAGLKISRYSPVTKAHELASEWMEKKKIPREKGAYPVSRYQQLRYALEDGDTARARNELAKLEKESSPDKIARGFNESISHPFTKSKAMDNEMRESLKPHERAIFDLAQDRREQILWRFQDIR